MANELRAAGADGDSLYVILMNSSGNSWNGSSFEAYSAANYSTYALPLSEEGSSGIFLGDFPSLITQSGTYDYFIKRQAGTSETEDDAIVGTGHVDWTGSSAAISVSDGMSASDWRNYVLRGGFKRTDKDTELYEETTDAIQEMRRRFGFSEAEIETTSTDSIDSLGDYTISLETDHGLLIGIKVIDGNNSTPLIQVTKCQFDHLYPDISVTNDKGYPKHFCIFNGNVVIGPVPDRISFSYRIAYSQRAGTVSSGTSNVPFTKEYRDVLRDLVLAKLYKGLDEFDKAQFFREEFENRWVDAKARERLNQGKGTFYVKPFGM